MDSSPGRFHKRTRRQFFSDVARCGVGVAGLALLGPHSALPVLARESDRSSERIEVLLHDLVERSAADFARGQARGVQIASTNGRAVIRGALGAEFTSGVLSLPFRATHVGLHWILPQDAPESAAIEVRTSASGDTWSEWVPPNVEAVRQVPGGREVFAALAGAGRGGFAQYRVTFQAEQVATLESMTVTAINSSDGPRVAVAASEAEPASQSFTTSDNETILVITRGGWGCDESLRWQDRIIGGTELWPEMYVPVKKFVLHHTATSNTYSEAGAAAEVRAIYSYHAVTQGWGDIGYNSLVDRFGNVYEGRHGRGEGSNREILSAGVVAGHVSGHNYGSTGLSAIGNSSARSPRDAWSPSTDFFTAVQDVATLECGRNFVDSLAASDFLKFDATWHNSMEDVTGHYESTSTECPGRELRSHYQLDSNPSGLARIVAGRLGSAAPALWETAGRPRDVATSTLSFAWSGNETQYYYCLEGWGRIGEYDVDYIRGYERDPSYPGDPLAMRQVWDGPTTATSQRFDVTKPGRYTMHVRTASGNYAASLTHNVTGVTSTDDPPSVVWVSPAGGATVSGAVSLEIGAGDDGGLQAVEWQLDTGALRAATLDPATGTYKANWDSASVSDGSHMLTARATDLGGQTSTASIEVTTSNSSSGGSTISVATISPNSVKAGASVAVTIKGSGFAAGASVLFENGLGPLPAASGIHVQDASTITATIAVGPMTKPPPKDRVWDVRVMNADGTTAALAHAFTVSP